MQAGVKGSKKKASKTSNEEILRIAKERFKTAEDAERDIRIQALDDHKFAAGEQWDERAKREREQDGRPCLVINRLPQSIHQITNDQKQNKPAIKVSPVDDKADIETAKIYQGIIRHIEYASNADVAYGRAFNSAVRGGFGYWRVVTEYCDPYSFDQEIKIKSIRNAFNVYLDPSYQEPDGSDANWGFVFEYLSKDDYLTQFPKSKLASMTDWSSVGDSAPGWIRESENVCRIAEYFYREFEEVELVLLSDGRVLQKNDLPKMLSALPPDIEIVGERKSQVPVIKWCKLNAVEVLEETVWPGKFIPIVPVLGEELDIDGKRILESLTRHAKDPQRMYNYWASAETEAIALAPRAPFIGYEGQFEGHEHEWATANRRNHAFLQVKPITVNGQPAPLPQRNSFEPAVQAISQARMLSSDDLKSTMGIYDAALGNQSNETSGIAIHRRNVQAQTSNYHFVDNLNKSIRHTGRILLDLIPKIYDTARAVRILGEEGDEEVIRVNEEFDRNGERVRYDLGVGKYDVTISTGPSFETKRQEASAGLLDLAKTTPQLMGIGGDIVFKALDMPYAQELAERFRRTIPPNILGEENQLPPEVQAQMAQMNQLIEALTEQLNEKTKLVETKTLELESKERIEMAKLQTQLEIEAAKMGSQEALALLHAEIDEIQMRLNMLRINEPIEHANQEMNQDFNPNAGPSMDQSLEIQQPLTGEQTTPGQFME